MSKKLLLVNGPNLNMLGKREPETYGTTTLAELETQCKHTATQLGVELACVQSNHEGEIIDIIQRAKDVYDGLIINPGAFTHSSIAIMDALLILTCPIIEVHISNIHARESFRHQSYVSGVAAGVICGLGIDGYHYAIEALAKRIKAQA